MTNQPLEHLRDIPRFWALRGQRPIVAICRDDAADWEPDSEALRREDVEVILEPAPGPVSARAGRPMVVVTDRWQEVVNATPNATADEVLAIVRWLGICCDECPQAMLEPGGEGWRHAPLVVERSRRAVPAATYEP